MGKIKALRLEMKKNAGRDAELDWLGWLQQTLGSWKLGLKKPREDWHNTNRRPPTQRTPKKWPQNKSQTKEEEVPPAVKPGDLVYVKTFRRKWHTPRREGPYEVVNATSTAVQVKGSPTWYHLNHCVKAPADGNGEKTIKEKEKNDHGCQGDDSLEGGDEDPRGAGNDHDSTAEFPDVILVEGTGTPTGRET
uniref:Murine leukemia virus integrase C-terminal domain-containing protein n=1 Tax=Knipowitschia caucasica TaxID=637954 RepID=A0AAV2MNW0_KNICA